jgi:hypothetical protein
MSVEFQELAKYADVFRRQPDGTWRFALVVWNAMIFTWSVGVQIPLGW